ncbi:hypothetical protein ACQ4M4_27010 [Leptolyngbya sp. AN02str]|uniref:hypothetical protein n=1 Tax=Leptolyngbya sp. AN02str TaxID=3423363 RepID=UPI003D3116FE
MPSVPQRFAASQERSPSLATPKLSAPSLALVTAAGCPVAIAYLWIGIWATTAIR